MLLALKGLKSSFISIIAFTLMCIFVIQSQDFWLAKSKFIEQLVLVLLVTAILFSAYFSRSRLSICALLLLAYYLNIQQVLPWSVWLAANNHVLLLFSALILTIFGFLKDRGLVSVHGFYRAVLVAVCAAIAYFWFEVVIASQGYLDVLPYYDLWSKYLSLEIPVAICVVALFLRCLFRNSLVTIALLLCLSVWILKYYQVIQLPWFAILAMLAVYFILIISIDSYFLAYRDDLTTLPSRRALNQLALALGRKYSVAMLDIDHFKKFNDTYGHDIGDQVLKLVASKLAQVKGGGKVFRYGGEEFTIVFPRKLLPQCLQQLEEVRQAVQDYKIVIRHPQRKTKQQRSIKKSNDMKTVSVTISIGVSQRQHKQNFEQALKAADEALYRAKKKGRNNVSE